MRLALALLADYAQAHQDGRLHVVGGGIRSLTFATFPATQQRLALALGIELERAELGLDHLLQIEASGPADQPVSRPVRVTFKVDQAERASGGYFHFVSTSDASFPVEGTYEFAITIDGEPLEQLRLMVRRGGQPSDDSEVETLLQEGFTAFGRGDRDSAEEGFRKVAERFPNAAGGHNNLGFVLLAKGDAAGALDAFAKAMDLGFPQNEITDANVAAASYILGDSVKALGIFVICLRERIFRTPAVLFGIGPSGLFPIQLQSAAEYTSLMALNAAWSAMRAGDREAFRRYLDISRASELPMRGDEAARVFAESVHALEAADPGPT